MINIQPEIEDHLVVVNEKTRLKWQELASEFAKTQNESCELYRDKRSGKNPLLNITLGKTGELYAARYAWKRWHVKWVPGFKVRYGVLKGWYKDLSSDEGLPEFEIKTSDRNTWNLAYDYSWTFQYQNKDGNGGRDKFFDIKEGWVFFVFMESLYDNKAIIKAILPFSFVLPLLKDPVVKELVGIKKCVYYCDLVAAVKVREHPE